MPRKIAIIGAGPVGLEAALQGLDRGYDCTVYERGVIADAVRQWGHVRMFSPFQMNASARGMGRLRAVGIELPDPSTVLTGTSFRESYLLPLAKTLQSYIKEKCCVVAIGRSRRLKSDLIAAHEREATPFRLFLRDNSCERSVHADIVLDCSGTYFQPNSLGEGGVPIPGESACSANIHYGIPDRADNSQAKFANGRILVVGAGHSAATVIRDLAPQSRVIWLVRHDREQALAEVPNDPLPERSRLITETNQLVRAGQVQLLTGGSVDRLVAAGDGIEVSWSDDAGKLGAVKVDEIIAATGYRPDLALTRELQVQTCWATEGTYPLAASLLGATGADCLTTPAFGAERLLHPEPGYFTLGIKSYGRAPNFLLRTGYEQVTSVFDWLERRPESALT